MNRTVGAACLASVMLADTPRAAASAAACSEESRWLSIGESIEVLGEVNVGIRGCHIKGDCWPSSVWLFCWSQKYKVARLQVPSGATCTFAAERGFVSGPIEAVPGAAVFTAPSSGELRCRAPEHLSAEVEADARAHAQKDGYECSADARPTMPPESCRIDFQEPHGND